MIAKLNSEMAHNACAGRRILVTGGAGYLATNLIGMLQNVDCHIIRLARSGAVLDPMNGVAQIEDVIGDVRERSTWERVLAGIDLVFHFAAQTSVYVANENPSADLESNVMPMLHLLEICRQQGWQPTVLFASTVTIAGLPTGLPVDETHPDHPMTVYDLHKLMAEQYLKWYVSQGVVRGATLRLANVYGPGPKSSRSDRGILNQMIRRALAGEVLTVYKPGDRLRDYVYVEDVSQAFLEAARHIEAVNEQHFIIGSGQGHTLAQAMNLVADRVTLKTGQPVEVKYIAPPSPQSPIEYRNFVADSRRFSEATNWRASYSLVKGIDCTAEVFLSTS